MCLPFESHSVYLTGSKREISTQPQVPIHKLGSMSHPCGHCGSLNFLEERVGGSGQVRFNHCCKGGKLAHTELKQADTPPALVRLLRGKDSQATKFRQHIRHYNGAFAFVSFGSDYGVGQAFVDMPGYGQAPPLLKCHGTVYHVAGQLFPDDPEEGKYAQLYFYDHGLATLRRGELHPTLDPNVLEALDTMLRDCCPYVEGYRMMKDLDFRC